MSKHQQEKDETSARKVLERTTSDKTGILINILRETITSHFGLSVYDISQEHKVIGIFIKWFGCPMCAEVIEVVGKMLPTCIKLNTIPIIFHQENEKDAKKAMETSKDLNVKYLPYCKASKELQKAVGIHSASVGNHMEAMAKCGIFDLVLGPKKRSFTIPVKVTNPMSQFGVISIDKGIITKKVVYSTLHKRINFGLFMNDIGSNLISSKMVEKLKKEFPLVTSQELERVDNTKVSNEEWSEIEEVLADEVGRYYFKAHATNEFSVENLLVCEEVSKFKGMPLQKDFKIQDQIEKAMEIYETFLTTDSILQLNIQEELGKDYRKRIEKLQHSIEEINDLATLFDDLILEIRSGVIKDTFSRFKQTGYYKEYRNGEKGEKTMTYLI
eukprot:gene11453-4618_t